MSADMDSQAFRTKALVGLTFAVVIAIAAWIGLSTATKRGLERLAAIDRARAHCARSWGAAKTRAESLAVDGIGLADTIDRQSANAIDRCDDLREQPIAAMRANPREMNGQPMPRGLR